DGAHAIKAVATDAAGNSGAASGVLAVMVDTAKPTLAISSDKSALKAGETATITFTFSEDPGSSFSAGDITVSGGSLGAMSGSGNVRTAVFTPAADTNASTATVGVAAGAYSDAAGNAGGAGTVVSLAFDTKAPAALLAPRLAPASDSGASANDGVTNAANLVFGGSAEEGALVTLVNTATGAVLGTSAVTAGAWSVTVSGVAEGALTVAAFAEDAAGNKGALSPAALVTVDRTAPAAPSVSAAESPRMNVSGLAEGSTWEYSTDGGAHWSMGAGSSFVLTSDGSYSVVVRQRDVAGNASPASTALPVLLDTTQPGSQVALSDTGLTKGETAIVTISFSEAVTGFDLGDISASNATLSQLESADGGRTWTALLTPAVGVMSTSNAVTVNNAGVRDLSGNPGLGTSSSPNYTVQTAGLGATIDLSDTALAAGETALVTITFSEPVRGFTLADLAVENGKLSQLTSSDGGRTWTALLTPTSSISDATNHLVLDNAGVSGASGVRGEGTTVSANYTVNTVRPTAAISIADHLLAPGASTTVTIRFSEAVSGFDSADMAASVGTLSNLASSDGGLTWTARLTADSNGKSAQPGFVSLDLGGVRNVGGNSGQGKVAVQFVQAPANAQLGTVDGVTVISQAVPDPVTGRMEQVVTVPEVTSGRQEDPLTPNGALADIPIGSNAAGGAPLTASLPVGAGLQVSGPAAPLNGADALLDLVRRIESTTTPGSATQADMSGHGQDFLSSLGSGTLVESKTVVPTVAPGSTLAQPIVISGAAPAPGNPAASVVGLVIDGSGLPAGSTLQLDNVEFAAVVGDMRLFGGAGRNYVV
ncbi:MAG TPA: Ig-like domain-containing protein, partial [Telluria sp.]|nr:Ig-like domain-containing protein [Telluria sp.]